MARTNDIATLLVYGKNGRRERIPASLAIKSAGKKQTFVGIPDITGDNSHLSINVESKAKLFKLQKKNHELNLPYCVHKNLPQTNTVVIAAPGMLPKSLPHGIPVIAVNEAVWSTQPDYAVFIDPHKDLACGRNAIGTVAVLSTFCHPKIRGGIWRDVTWFTNLPMMVDGLPASPSTEGVITDALWFAVKQLGAKKVIMVGVEQPATDKNYYWEGIFLQAHCYWYSKKGIEIWNCTPATSVVAGVKLGTLEEACR